MSERHIGYVSNYRNRRGGLPDRDVAFIKAARLDEDERITRRNLRQGCAMPAVDDIVVFELRSPKDSKRPVAVDVAPFDPTKDPDLIAVALWSGHEILRRGVLPHTQSELIESYIIALREAIKEKVEPWRRGKFEDDRLSELLDHASESALSNCLAMFSVASEKKLWRHAVAVHSQRGDLGAVESILSLHQDSLDQETLGLLPPQIALTPPYLTKLDSESLFRSAAVLAAEGPLADDIVQEICHRLSLSWSERQVAAQGYDTRVMGLPKRLMLWSERDRYAEMLPEHVLTIPMIADRVSPRLLVRMLYSPLPAASLWARLPLAARAVWIHRALLEENGLQPEHPAVRDLSPLLVAQRALYGLLREDGPVAEADVKRCVEVFDRALHRFLLRAMEGAEDQLIDLRPILPECLYNAARDGGTPNVPHCEGRRRQTMDEGEDPERPRSAFCPRTARRCELLVRVLENGEKAAYYHSSKGARTESTPGLDWSHASLNEVLDELRAPPPKGFRKEESYATAVAGYANRLNEIRRRLKCPECDERLRPNYNFAKRLARYNKTFFMCRNGHLGELGRYFNHCWCCSRVIDSAWDTMPETLRACAEKRMRAEDTTKEGLPRYRYSPITVGDSGEGGTLHRLYLCIYCGAGLMPKTKGFRPIGSTCPSCGIDEPLAPTESKSTKYVRRRCRRCAHTITVSADKWRDYGLGRDKAD